MYPRSANYLEREEIYVAQPSPPPASRPPGTKTCPDCAEDVRIQAAKCRYCGYRFDAPGIEPPTLTEQTTKPAVSSTKQATVPAYAPEQTGSATINDQLKILGAGILIVGIILVGILYYTSRPSAMQTGAEHWYLASVASPGATAKASCTSSGLVSAGTTQGTSPAGNFVTIPKGSPVSNCVITYSGDVSQLQVGGQSGGTITVCFASIPGGVAEQKTSRCDSP